MSRMNWSRAKKQRQPAETPRQRRLERQADHMILNGHHANVDARRPAEPIPERVYYRSCGSVMEKDGRWFALDSDGEVVGEFPHRWMAWQLADKYGIEIAGRVS